MIPPSHDDGVLDQKGGCIWVFLYMYILSINGIARRFEDEYSNQFEVEKM